jgi:hypothetical protein
MDKFKEGDYVRVKQNPTADEKKISYWNGEAMDQARGKIGQITSKHSTHTDFWRVRLLGKGYSSFVYHYSILTKVKKWRVKKEQRRESSK